MSTAADATVILLQQDPIQEKLIATALQSMKIRVRKISASDSLQLQLKMLTTGNAKNRRVMIIADLVRLAKEHLSFDAFARQIKSQLPQCALIATNSQVLLPQGQAIEWIKNQGGMDLFGRFSSRRYIRGISPLLGYVSSFFELEASADQLKSFATGMLVSEDPKKDPYDLVQQAWRLLDELSLQPAQLADQMAQDQQGIPVTNRRYRLKLYQQCLLGKDAHQWLVTRLKVTADQALAIGNLLVKCRLIEHVTRSHDFEASGLFYRYQASSSVTRRLDFSKVIQDAPEIFNVQDRHWRGMSFSRCFTGDQAVTAMIREYGVTELEALWLGQQLQDLYLYRHVTDEHDFLNQSYFYRLTKDEEVSI